MTDTLIRDCVEVFLDRILPDCPILEGDESLNYGESAESDDEEG